MIKIISIDEKPISLIGKCAAVCYGKPIEDGYSGADYKRGLACIESNHGRALEYAGVIVEVSGYSARCIREVYTHIVGTTRLQESTRYIDMDGFGYFMPDSIRNNPKAHMLYVNLMDTVRATYEQLRAIDIPVEDCANTLPLAYNTRITFKINVRSLLHLAEERLCSRAYHEIRDFVHEFKKTLLELDNDEWDQIVVRMRPKCENIGYCPEKKGCGRWPSKDEAKKVLLDFAMSNKKDVVSRCISCGVDLEKYEPGVFYCPSCYKKMVGETVETDILNKKFNLPGETRTCPICGKPIHSSLKICVECFNEIMPVNTDVDDGRYIPNMFGEACTDDGKIDKMDRV